jgi:hypothetical protein
MRVMLFALAEAAIIDQRSNLLSVINIIEEINASAFPLLIPRSAVVLMAARNADEPEQMECVVTAKLDQEVLFNIPTPLNYQGRLRLRYVTEMQGVLIPRAGNFTLTLMKNNVETASWSLLLQQVAQPMPIFQAGAG